MFIFNPLKVLNEPELAKCNAGDPVACVKAYKIEANHSRITNNKWLTAFKKSEAKRAAEKVQLEKNRKAASVKIKAEEKARKAKIAEENRKAEAKFKAEGWFQVSPGIYGRWCTETCSRAEVIGSSSYWLMEVWAKDRAAGDIYAQINVMQNGTVIGWTNDTAFLAQGQKGVLTFTKYLPGNGSQYQAQLVKFNARGSW